MKITLVANSSWYVLNFRSNLINKLKEKGHIVSVIAPKDDYSSRLKNLEINYYEWTLSSSSTNIFKELFSVLNLRSKLKKINTDAILSFTPKGNIYSGIIHLILSKNTKFIPNISGLGIIMRHNFFLRKIIFIFYKLAFINSNKIFFQNNEDMDLFIKNKVVKARDVIRLPGSGVDTNYFKQDRYVPSDVFLFAGRLIYSKGLNEFLNVAKKIKNYYPSVLFKVVGAPAKSSKLGISEAEIPSFSNNNAVEYLGATDNIREIYTSVGAVVLPSYYGEGVPRTLLEASSMGIPIITTNHPGCRDSLDHNITGFLCNPMDEISLFDQCMNFLKLSDEERCKMGAAGRVNMIKNFSEDIVIKRYLDNI